MFQHCAMMQSSNFCVVQDIPILNINFQQQRLKPVMIKSMRFIEVYTSHHNFHNMFKVQSCTLKWLLLDEAV
jgi:hypothetical protein